MIGLITVSGCNPFSPSETIRLDHIYWSAFGNPETFDSWLEQQSVDPRAAGCFRQLANELFAAEQTQLQQCGQLVSRSVAWNECHEQAEQHHNSGVLANDIALAIDGARAFSATSSYQYLTIAKVVLESEGFDWNGFVDGIRNTIPVTLECEV